MNIFRKISAIAIAIVLVFQSILPGSSASSYEIDAKQVIAQAVKWLEQNQNSNGSWGAELPFMETGEVLFNVGEALFSSPDVPDKAAAWLEAQNPQNNDELLRRLAVPAIQKQNGLAELIDLQNPDGGWGLSIDHQSDVLDTLLALDALMSVSIMQESIVNKAVSYLLSAQKKDGGWGYASNSQPSVYLTAHAMTTLQRYKSFSRQPSDGLEFALINGRQYLLANMIDNGTWGLLPETIKATIFACGALKHTDSDIFDAALEKLVGMQQTDGSLYSSPLLTSRLVWLLGLPEKPFFPDNPIQEIIITAPDYIIAYTDISFLPIMDDVYEATMIMSAYVETPDNRLIPLTRSAGRYNWNTGQNEPGLYNVVVLIWDTDSEQYINIERKEFVIEDSFAVTSLDITFDPQYYRLGRHSDVMIGLNVQTQSNIPQTMTAMITVLSEDEREVLLRYSKKIVCGGTADNASFPLVLFEPEVSQPTKYIVNAILRAQNAEGNAAQKILEVYPPPPDMQVELDKSLNKSKLMPGEDDIELTLKVNSFGNIPEDTPSKTYDSSDDFRSGTSINIAVGQDGGIALDETTKPFHFIWVANSTKGTVMKINTDTCEVIGEYWTSPQGQPRNPSRTTVDHDGNVWVANRDGNSVTKIGLVENGGWIDKDGDGICTTSSGLNDIKPWTNTGSADTNGGVSTAIDECILLYIRVSSSGTRHVSVNKDNNVWVSGTGHRIFDLIDGETGRILRTEGSVGYGAYGGLIDANGVIWSSNPLLRWDTYLPLSGPNGINWNGYSHDSYGLAIDSNGFVWNTSYGNGYIRKFAPDGALVGTYYQGYTYSQGVAAGLDDDIWISHSLNRASIGRMKNDGTYVGTLTTIGGTIGVAIDALGYVWITTTNGYVQKIDPNDGPIGADGVTPIGQILWTSPNFNGTLYNYSDMTGSTLTAPPNRGTWAAIYDSGEDNAEWGSISWAADIPDDGRVEVFASSSKDGVNFSDPSLAENGQVFDLPPGRYIKAEVRLRRSSEGESPVISSITVSAKAISATDIILAATIPGEAIPIANTAITPAPDRSMVNTDGSFTVWWDIPKIAMGKDLLYMLNYQGEDLKPDSMVTLAKDIVLSYTEPAESSSAIKTFKGHSYLRIDEPMPWHDAKAYCESLGGHLATITSQEEQSFIEGLITDTTKMFYFLGGTDEEKEGEWKWVTGEEWGYTNWFPGMPDNCSGIDFAEQDYLAIGSGMQHNNPAWGKFLWQDIEAFGDSAGDYIGNNSGFICEWDNLDVIPNRFSIELEPITVKVNPSRVLGKINLDKPAYNVHEDVQISITAHSFIEPPKTLTGTVEITDPAGDRVVLLDGNLEFDNEISEFYVWNTGDILSGLYAVRLQLYDGAVPAFEAMEYFYLRPEGGFSNGVYCEKPAYHQEAVAVLHDTVENSFVNYYPGRVTDTITVADAVGNVMFSQVFDLGNLLDPERSVSAQWYIGNIVPGPYTVTAVVREDGVIMAQSETVVTVLPEGEFDIQGELRISQTNIPLGSPVELDYDLGNFGNEDIEDALAVITVISPDSLTKAYTTKQNYVLPVGEMKEGETQVPADVLGIGKYLALYAVEIDGISYPLQSAAFEVGDVPHQLYIVAGEGGSISKGEEGQYIKDKEIAIEATADSGYRFTAWTTINGGDFADLNNASTIFTMPNNATAIIANFEEYDPPKYDLTITAGTGGRIITGSSWKYAAGDKIELVAEAGTGYRFKNWVTSDGGIFEDANNVSTIFTMPGNATDITAVFEDTTLPPNKYDLTITAGIGGRIITGSGGKYEGGDKIELAAEADPGYHFLRWTTSNGGTFINTSTVSTTFTMPANNTEVTATFEEDSKPPTDKYDLTIIAGTGGQILTGSNGKYETGEKIELKAQANSGYRFIRWASSNGGSFENAQNISTSFTMPANNTTVEAVFERVSSGSKGSPRQDPPKTEIPEAGYLLTLLAGEGGKIIEGSSGYYEEDEEIELVAEALEGYRFKNWTTSELGVFANSSAAKTTFIMPACTTTVTANFESLDAALDEPLATRYTLTVKAEKGGKIVAGSNGQYEEGEVIDLAAVSESGYRFAGWVSSKGGVFEDAAMAATKFTMPGNNTTITAKFERVATGGSPKTGDDSKLWFYLTLAGIALIVLLLLSKEQLKSIWKNINRIISIILIVSLLAQMAPLSIIADAFTTKAALAAEIEVPPYEEIIEEDKVDAPLPEDFLLEGQTEISAEIKTLADSMSPVEIYQYVRNNINVEFSFGSKAGALGVFEKKSGNDIDTASLLIAMLRHKGIAARYVKGKANLSTDQAMGLTSAKTPDNAAKTLAAQGIPTTVFTSQGKIAYIQIERIWAEAYIAYDNYRGAGSGLGKAAWIPLDAGFKLRQDSLAIIPETLGLLPASLPYAILPEIETFSTTDPKHDPTAPEINYDIPYRLELGESYECSVEATGVTAITSLTVSQNGNPVGLLLNRSFIFTAEKYGSYVFVIKAVDEDGSYTTITHTLLVEDLDTTPPELAVEFKTPDGIGIDKPVEIHVTATDDSGSVTIVTKVDDKEIEGQDNVYIFYPDAYREYSIVVTAVDPSGNWSEKSYIYTLWEVVVGDEKEQKEEIENVPPPDLEVSLEAPDGFGIGKRIIINVDASESDAYQPVSVEVTVNGKTIDFADGEYLFVTDKYGDYEIAVTATNRIGSWVRQTMTYTLKSVIVKDVGEEIEEKDNIPPPELSVSLEAPDEPGIGKTVNISVDANDNEEYLPIEISVTVNEEIIDFAGGEYSFVTDQYGDYLIAVTAKNKAGSWIKKTMLTTLPRPVSKESPKVLAYYPASTIGLGETLPIDIEITDSGGDVTVEVLANGEDVPYENGRAYFTPSQTGEYLILITVTNEAGNDSKASFTINVTDEPQDAQIFMSINGYEWDEINIGEEAGIWVGGTGIAKDSSIILTANGIPLLYDDFGHVIFKPEAAGLYIIRAEAQDTRGKTIKAASRLVVKDPENKTTPEVIITTPSESDSAIEITEPTDIIGTITEDGLLYYTLAYAPADTDSFTIIAQGDEALNNEKIGTFDPTLLNNGYYIIRLMGYGSNDFDFDELVVLVQGEMKIGNYSLAFEDMVFAVGNFPLFVNRCYDSRDKDESGDFGYGWNLSLAGAKLSVSCDPASYWAQKSAEEWILTKYLFTELRPHEVSVDWGNGKTERFSMKLNPDQQMLYPIRYINSVFYEAQGSSKSKLEVLGITRELIYFNDTLYNYNLDPYNPTGYRLTTVDGMIYVFNANGDVESIKDSLGNIITINKNGVYHSDGKSILFQRDKENRITKITGPTGQEVLYGYNTAGDLVSFMDVGKEITKFSYNNKHFLKDIIDPRGVRVARNEYDDDGRLTATVDADGNRMEFDHDIEGRRSSITDRLGYVTQFVYDSRGNIISTTDALGNTTYNSYDTNGNLETKTDAIGNVTSYEYSPDGRLLSLTDVYKNTVKNTFDQKDQLVSISALDETQLVVTYNNLGLMTKTEDAMGYTTDYAHDNKGRVSSITDEIGVYMRVLYDANGNVASATNGAGDTATFTYDADNNCKSKTLTRTTASGIETITENYNYDIYGNISQIIYGDGTITNLEYNAIGKMSAAVDSKSRRTSYDYDIFGNLVKINYWDGTSESFEYDKEQRNIKATDRMGRSVTMDYDAVGNLLTKNYPNGAAVSYDYDKKYRLTSVEEANGGITKYEYDKADRNTAIIDALDNRTEFAYDDFSRLTSMTDPKGNTYRFEYDKNGNRTKMTMPDDTAIVTNYDARGRITSQADQSGYLTSYTYDGVDRLTGVTDVLNNKWSYTYNEVGELTAVKDANENVTRYEYDKLGRVIKTRNALGHEASATYDESGNVLTSTDFAGVTTNFSYDDLDRLTKKETGTEVTEFTYKVDGMLESVTDASGMTSYIYDIMNGLTEIKLPDGDWIRYDYDKACRLTKVETAYGSVSYEYDLLDRLAKVTSQGEATTYEYDENGNRLALKYANGMTTNYHYDNLNRLIREEIVDKSNAVVAKYIYTLGNSGERLKVEEIDRTVEYEYDKLYRLTKETITRGSDIKTTAYTYDAVSNRLTKTENGTLTNYSYNALNQLTIETGITYSYDLNGSLISQTGADKTVAYAYNKSNRLTKATIQSGEGTAVEEYRYDWAGNRISKTTNGITTKYLVDTNGWLAQVVAELDGSGNLKTFYTRGDELLSLHRKDETRYYLYDGHGSVRLLADKDAAVTDTYIYDAFGNLIDQTGSTENNYLYCGEQFDSTTGLYYLRARYMNPSTGTFILRDAYPGSVFDPVSLHKYLYANANPVMYCDPAGYSSLTLPGQLTVVAVIGILADIAIPFLAHLGKIALIGGLVAGSVFIVYNLVEDWLLDFGSAVGNPSDRIRDYVGEDVLPPLAISMPTEFEEVLAKAIEKDDKNEYRYFSAVIEKDDVLPIAALTLEQAIVYTLTMPPFLRNQGVMAMTEDDALELLIAVGDGYWDKKHDPWSYNHFHPNFNKNFHIWYFS
ncbi:MAG: InlB B-repeat-containing protein [Clostridiales bacterium]|jgi:RHS repeat-associated protein|nr:InlB B-repeat-containing protein [Clostridiales bacterium]